MIQWLIVGTGGFFGAIARYALSGWVQQRWDGPFPIGTLAVNVLGCLILGGLMALVEDHPMLTPQMRLLVATGMLGAFTTFSTFGYETAELLHQRETWAALASIGLNLGVGLGAVELGRALVRLLGI